ncbi:MAG: hypothetical protein ED556_08800 [Winogradskyella sp.]|uniref:hypothetical protein n=1 Tax=Winogradskyella sp. TaxID=1883156 RepID=UPI000F3D1AD9|nr:hypothetical protein [Winogradskyella sp.]RNC86381.1 MAG: hypothetical protein ED556_08800 [Winogradskyella sp.]
MKSSSLTLIVIGFVLFGCTSKETITNPPELLRFETINYYKFPKGNDAKPFKYRLTYYFDNGIPHRWIELDSLKKVTTEYIYEYDENWKHIGAKYREDGEMDYDIENVRFIDDRTQVTEWLDSLGQVYYTMTDFLNEDGKTIRAEFKGDKVHGYDSTLYNLNGDPKRIFFTNTKGKVFNDRHFEYDSINDSSDWVTRRKIMQDTVREVQSRALFYNSKFTAADSIYYPNILSTKVWSENVFSFTEDEKIVFQTKTKDWNIQYGFLSKTRSNLFYKTEKINLLDSIYNGAISPSGAKIIYSKKENDIENIWLTVKTGNNWSTPINLSENSNITGGYFYWLSDNELCFYVNDNNGDIVQAQLNENVLKITDRFDTLNTLDATEFSPYMDKEMKFIIFTRYLETDTSQQGFFISYNNGSKTKPKWSLPEKIEALPYGWNAYLVNNNRQFLYTNGEDIKSISAEDLNLKL